jgi:hypothetical protein
MLSCLDLFEDITLSFPRSPDTELKVVCCGKRKSFTIWNITYAQKTSSVLENDVIVEIFTTVAMKITVVWDMMSCSLVDMYNVSDESVAYIFSVNYDR